MSRLCFRKQGRHYKDMLAFLWSAWVLLAMVKGQGGPPSGEPAEQECILLLVSDMNICDDETSKSYMDASGLETVRYNETISFVTGQLTTFKTFEDSTRVEIQLFKLANGKKEMMMTMEIELCKELLKKEESDFHSLLQYMGFPPECPIEPGVYPVNNLMADLKDLPINQGNIGEYEATMNFWKCNDEDCKDREFESCMKLDVIIEPKD